MKKQEKKLVIENLTKDFQEAKSISLVDFAGMNIVSQQDLKKKLKTTKSKMIVAKNTLIKLAIEAAKLPKEAGEDSILSGQTAVILGLDDPISPIQIVGKAAAESNTIKFKAGILEGIFQNKESLVAISKLPSKEVLASQTVGTIASPMYMLISNLQANVQELIGTIAAKVG